MFALSTQLWLNLTDEFVIAHSFERFIEQGLVVVAVVYQRHKILIDDLVIVWELIGLNEVSSADFGAVDLEFLRRKVKHPLDDEDSMLTPRAAIGCDDGLVGEDRRELAVIILDVVRSEQST